MKKAKSVFTKSNALILVLLTLFLCLFGYECYSVSHIELKTQTVTVATVYDKIDTTALIVRDEEIVSSSSAVTVPCVEDGEKVARGGNVAMCFSSQDGAKSYSSYEDVTEKLNYYEALQAQSTSKAVDLDKINDDVNQRVLDYANSLYDGDSKQKADELNSVLVRRQSIIGEDVDLVSRIQELRTQQESLSSTATPQSYIKAENSGVFSSYTDGLEEIVDYSKVKELNLKQLTSAIKTADTADKTQENLGKIIKNNEWYMLCEVDAADFNKYKKDKFLDVVLKNDTSKTLKMKLVKEIDSTEKGKTVLMLMGIEMNDEIARYRVEEIEIRKAKYEGFKIPNEYIHIKRVKEKNEETEKMEWVDRKGVYVLVSSQVRFRKMDIIYKGDDYVIAKKEINPTNTIHLYDKIIIQGRALEDGKVYT